MISRAQVQFLRIGDHFINVDQIAYVQFIPADQYNGLQVDIHFAALGPEGYGMSLTFRNDEAIALEPHLRSHLGLATVAHIDLPTKQVEES